MRGQQQVKEFSAYGVNTQSLSEIQDLQKDKEIQVIRIMHSDKLLSLKGLEQFVFVRDLNISSCSIERMECLQNLIQLQVLNLSCNRIQIVQGLVNCKNLKKLVLSHNKISNLSGLSQLKGEDYSLENLDLRNNKLQNLKDLLSIQELGNLKELNIYNQSQGKNQSNVCCLNQDQYWLFLSKFKNFENLQKIDGLGIHEFKRYLSGTKKIDQKIGVLDGEENMENIHNLNQQQVEQYGQQQLIDMLKQEVMRLAQDKKSLGEQIEENQQFWNEKCEQLTQEINFQVQENKDKIKQMRKLQSEFQLLQQQYDDNKQSRENVIAKNEKKEQLVDNLQLRITELIRENGEQQRELQLRYDQIQKLLSEEREYQKQIQELKGQLKESERTLQHFHNQALESANTNLVRNEDIRRKYENTFEENKKLQQEVFQMKERQNELLDICREWEYKFDKKIDEINYTRQNDQRDQREQLEKQKQEIEKKYEEEITNNNKIFQENLDLYENEFKKVLNERNEKFQNLRNAYEEKSQSEQDSKQLMKIAVNKTNEYEQIINEQQNALLKLKRQINDIKSEKEVNDSENEHKIRTLQGELDIVIEEKNKYQNERMEIERKFSNQNELNLNEKMELEKLRQKVKYFEEIEFEIEEIQANLNTKNKMLDDKNETIEELQMTVENYKKNESISQDDYNRLIKKYEKQNAIIEEIEEINGQQQSEIDQLNKELQDKKNIITLFERELNDIKNKQEKEIVQLKNEIKDKDSKIIDLLDLLDECKETLNQKENISNEKEDKIKFYEKSIVEREQKFEYLIKQKENQYSELQKQYEETQQNLVIVLQKFEQQKKIAKENIQKLQKDFNL